MSYISVSCKVEEYNNLKAILSSPFYKEGIEALRNLVEQKQYDYDEDENEQIEKDIEWFQTCLKNYEFQTCLKMNCNKHWLEECLKASIPLIKKGIINTNYADKPLKESCSYTGRD